ncbi:hydroxyacylglutathione hydrolase [Methanolinea mesophila]|uniref:MBL fold metallo-hydrolase n=1 Tax=Methanolinea mesophila TaxID=547055 RepID=UPI001AE89709|nr:rhodanese-like domain-containing protein [Methanolinea mesophila]MBP1929592.1 hydroxyacylglutathione hydrolase [Methanolinea mesophila]
MILRQITSPGLAHNSYFLGSQGMAIVIDPRRDCEVFLELAREHDMRITHIFETHRNEDYVIGSLELAARCGAAIFHGKATEFAYGTAVSDGDEFAVGSLRCRVLETPGHTMEHIAVAVTDTEVSALPFLVFSGDALFAGDVGRTDFFGQENRARVSGMLYDSIHEKILPLGDGVIMCPAHGAGSVCGAEIADHQFSTIGYEKATNPLLKMDRQHFIGYKVAEHHYMPPYFGEMERLNQFGPPVKGHVPDLVPMEIGQVKNLMANGVQILDIRAPTSFAGGHIPGSISIWREGISAYAGYFLDYHTPIVLVADFDLGLGQVAEFLFRMGYDNLEGYLAGGFPAWFKAGERTAQSGAWTVQKLSSVLSENRDLFLLDVRDINNREDVGYIPGSAHIYAGELPDRACEVPKDRLVVVYCDAGYKGSLGASILSRLGYPSVVNLLGGMGAWIKAGYPVAGKNTGK